MSKEDKKGRFILLTEWPQYHPWPKINGLRELRAKNLKQGGLDFFIKAGGRVLVDEQAFFTWLNSNRGQ
jgi:hypothetical protein